MPRARPPRSATATEAGAAGVETAAAAMSKVGAPYSPPRHGPVVVRLLRADHLGHAPGRHRDPAHELRPVRLRVTASSAPASEAGDLVFFNTAGPERGATSASPGRHAVVSATTHGVISHAIFEPYWGAHFVGAKRVA